MQAILFKNRRVSMVPVDRFLVCSASDQLRPAAPRRKADRSREVLDQHLERFRNIHLRKWQRSRRGIALDIGTWGNAALTYTLWGFQSVRAGLRTCRELCLLRSPGAFPRPSYHTQRLWRAAEGNRHFVQVGLCTRLT